MCVLLRAAAGITVPVCYPLHAAPSLAQALPPRHLCMCVPAGGCCRHAEPVCTTSFMLPASLTQVML